LKCSPCRLVGAAWLLGHYISRRRAGRPLRAVPLVCGFEVFSNFPSCSLNLQTVVDGCREIKAKAKTSAEAEGALGQEYRLDPSWRTRPAGRVAKNISDRADELAAHVGSRSTRHSRLRENWHDRNPTPEPFSRLDPRVPTRLLLPGCLPTASFRCSQARTLVDLREKGGGAGEEIDSQAPAGAKASRFTSVRPFTTVCESLTTPLRY